jgi:hypothetical protein
MATTMFAKTLETREHSMWIVTKRRSYTNLVLNLSQGVSWEGPVNACPASTEIEGWSPVPFTEQYPELFCITLHINI